MKLDFSALMERTAEGRPESPVDGFNAAKGRNTPEKGENPTEGKMEAPAGEMQAGRLLTYYEREREDREKTRKAYSSYQRNIREAGNLRTEILNGVKTGEPAAAILLKAVKCIALMTGDTVFSNQAEGSIKSVYGAGLLERTIIDSEIRETQERLQRLQEALQRETEPQESRERIRQAIQAHKARIEELSEMKKNGKAQR